MRLTFGGVFIWSALAILYHQRRHVAVESLETDRLRKERATSGSESIFEQEDEDFLVARRRMRWLYRWLLPAFVLLTVVYLLAGFFVVWPTALLVKDSWKPVANPSLSMLIAAGIAFVSFLYSRYVSGMARDPAYRLLKAGSIYLFACALVGLLLTVCLGLVSTQMVLPERILGVAVRYLLVLLGLEFLVNFVLDFYRPRVADEVVRPAFESRLIGLVSEPEGIAKSIADAVNYQFGFEVSATWFYKVLERAVVPLAALSIIILIGMTSVAIVDADELAVIERFGRPTSTKPVGPGLVFKWPWPVEHVRKARVGLVQEIVVGEVEEEHREDGERDWAEEVITWTEEHKFVPSIDVLVATPDDDDQQRGRGASSDDSADDETVAVSILRMSMPVQYTVKRDSEGFFNYLYNYSDPQEMLRDISYRELVKQAVHFDYQKIMGEQRAEVTAILDRLIQEKCNEMKLGIDIVFVGLQDVHPPTESDVAATFQDVATAEQQRDTLIQMARIEAAKELIKVAGDVGRAEKINALILQKDELGTGDEQQREIVDREIQQYMLGDSEVGIRPIQGEAGELLQIARADAEDSVNRAAAKANTFQLERVAYEASPRLYKMRKVLEALSEKLDNVRKYVVVVDPEKTKLIIVLDEQESAGLEIIESPQ
ncbi:MAG: hypothetical protein IIA66_13110 [Planctomycetes bacterium]|nr:hypothetical protein [Planctomycetota bacterium]